MEETTLRLFVSYFGAGGLLLALLAAAGKGLLAWRSERNNQTPTEIANGQLAVFKTIAEEANKRADNFAQERNDLLVKVTRIESEMKHLHGVVELNEHLKQGLKAKDEEMRRALDEHRETTRLMLALIKDKDSLLMQQAERITVLEETVRSLQDQFRRGLPTCPHLEAHFAALPTA